MDSHPTELVLNFRSTGKSREMCLLEPHMNCFPGQWAISADNDWASMIGNGCPKNRKTFVSHTSILKPEFVS
jgi:hypothetical protein